MLLLLRFKYVKSVKFMNRLSGIDLNLKLTVETIGLGLNVIYF
jgi:hypothetical protein